MILLEIQAPETAVVKLYLDFQKENSQFYLKVLACLEVKVLSKRAPCDYYHCHAYPLASLRIGNIIVLKQVKVEQILISWY